MPLKIKSNAYLNEMEIEVVQDRGTGAISEDSLLVNHSVFGVFDGSTALNGATFRNGKTGGWLASNTAKDIFRQNNHPLTGLAEKANSRIETLMVRNGVNTDRKYHRWSTSLAVVKIHKDSFEWIQTGDCVILTIDKNGSYTIIADGWDQDKETLIQWKKLAGTAPGSIYESLADQLKKVRDKTNVTYGALNGEKQAIDFVQTGAEPLREIQHILIFTDGLQIPQEDPELERDYRCMVNLFLESGLSRVKEYVRSLEEKDPGCRVYPRFKRHDDIAAVSLTLGLHQLM